VVLFIEKIDLILQLLHVALIHLLLVLHVYLIHVLTTLIEHTETQDFVVSDFDCSVESFNFILYGKMLLDKLVKFLTELISSLIRATQLISPFLVLYGLTSRRGRVLHALITLTIVKLMAFAPSIWSQVLA